MNLTKRDLFVLAAVVRYAQSNADDINDALQDDEEPSVIILNGGDFFGTHLKEGELEELFDRLVQEGSDHE